MSVCGNCGILVVEAKSGRLVHVDDLPKDADPNHEIVPVAAADFIHDAEMRYSLKAAAEDMLVHHASFHPASDCPWVVVLERALRSA